MNKSGFGTLVLMTLVFSLVSPAFTSEAIIGEPAPAFTLKDVDGNDVSLTDFKGKIVILDFWAVWCGPCRLSLPFFQELADEYGERGLEVVGIHVDDRVPEMDEVKEYLASLDVRYLNLVSTFEVDESFSIFAMPTTYLVDREGTIAKRHVGFNPGRTPERLKAHLLEMLESDQD